MQGIDIKGSLPFRVKLLKLKKNIAFHSLGPISVDVSCSFYPPQLSYKMYFLGHFIELNRSLSKKKKYFFLK